MGRLQGANPGVFLRRPSRSCLVCGAKEPFMLKELLNWGGRRDLVELLTPRRSFTDVILPENTRQSLYEALMQIEKHSLIFQESGLGERHSTGTGLAFNFAGHPGTGKT